MTAPQYIYRKAKVTDVPNIDSILSIFSKEHTLLPLATNTIYEKLQNFCVATFDGNVVGCCFLDVYNEELGEVRSLAVSPEHHSKGVGQSLLNKIEEQAIMIGIRRLFALTYAVTFFKKKGYAVVSINLLPEKIWRACISCQKYNNCDETAVLKNINQP